VAAVSEGFGRRSFLLGGGLTAHLWIDKFSIAVTGSGTLLGLFVTDGMDRYFCATWYDYSDRAWALRKQEVALDHSKFAAPRYHRVHLAKPVPVDVTVSFKTAGDLEMVSVSGGKYRRTLSFPSDLSKLRSMSELDAMIEQILQAVAAVP
jgi:hypothetical protein